MTKTPAARVPRIAGKRAQRTLVAALRRAETRKDKPAVDRIKSILNGTVILDG